MAASESYEVGADRRERQNNIISVHFDETIIMKECNGTCVEIFC